MALTVSEVARLTGVTVRTLHHYDEVGLVLASGRTEGGHRVYDRDAVTRLRDVLLYRALGFPLAEIGRILDDPDVDRREALARQHELLVERARQTNQLLAAVEAEMDADEKGVNLTDEEMLEVFGAGFAAAHDEYDAEAEQRWGETDAFTESRRRTSQYTKDDWVEIRSESDATTQALAAAMRAGAKPESAPAMDAAEAARQHIDRRFYPCSHDLHAALGDMYVADPRFAKTYDDLEPGLAQYVRDAIIANGIRHT